MRWDLRMMEMKVMSSLMILWRMMWMSMRIGYMSIDVHGAPTTSDYVPWFLSITHRWMTPRGIIAASHYAPVAPTMTQFVNLHLHLNG